MAPGNPHPAVDSSFWCVSPGKQGVQFYTRVKTVTSSWQHEDGSPKRPQHHGVSTSMPTHS